MSKKDVKSQYLISGKDVSNSTPTLRSLLVTFLTSFYHIRISILHMQIERVAKFIYNVI